MLTKENKTMAKPNKNLKTDSIYYIVTADRLSSRQKLII